MSRRDWCIMFLPFILGVIALVLVVFWIAGDALSKRSPASMQPNRGDRHHHVPRIP